MKLIKNASGKTVLKLSKSDWLKIGDSFPGPGGVPPEMAAEDAQAEELINIISNGIKGGSWQQVHSALFDLTELVKKMQSQSQVSIHDYTGSDEY